MKPGEVISKIKNQSSKSQIKNKILKKQICVLVCHLKINN